MIDMLRNEIEEVHAFIAAWFRGDVERDDALYDKEFADLIALDLVNIQPSGQVLARADLVEGIRKGYGSNPEFQIRISDAVLRFEDKGKALVTYIEHQSGARNSAPENRRISSVWFDISPDRRATWLHIHETGCD